MVTPRSEVRKGRSFNADEFAIVLEQVVAGTAPDDYKKPEQFFPPGPALTKLLYSKDFQHGGEIRCQESKTLECGKRAKRIRCQESFLCFLGRPWGRTVV